MANMQADKVPMPEQDPNVRNKNFEEVTLGYTDDMAVTEAERCLNCKHKPCMNGCPVNVKIPDFVTLVAEKKFIEAYEVITSTNALPAVCGRVCPQETQCEQKCVRAIKGEAVAIGRLERFVADWYMNNVDQKLKKPTPNGKRVAVIGSGPSSLSCAGDLGKKGYDVTIYEAFHKAGGVLVYGIPEFRLPKAIVQKEIDSLKDIGVSVETNMFVGRVFSLDELLNDMKYDAAFIGTGAGLPTFMGISGEALVGVYSANEYLTRINLMKSYLPTSQTPIRKSKAVAVVGGGNVAMDAARCAKRMGAEHVYIVYRRSEEEIPARLEEIHHAKEEGIEFLLLNNPVKILDNGNGQVSGMECVKMELGEPDASGRRSPIVIEGSNFVLDVDTVVMAIGTSPNPLLRQTTKDLDFNKRGCLVVNEETNETTKPFVYAGGDAVTGAATVILAMGAGKIAAEGIDKCLMNC
ncbi:MAG: NADPH-dependent glutamate synthase [Bacillota bacterium]